MPNSPAISERRRMIYQSCWTNIILTSRARDNFLCTLCVCMCVLCVCVCVCLCVCEYVSVCMRVGVLCVCVCVCVCVLCVCVCVCVWMCVCVHVCVCGCVCGCGFYLSKIMKQSLPPPLCPIPSIYFCWQNDCLLSPLVPKTPSSHNFFTVQQKIEEGEIYREKEGERELERDQRREIERERGREREIHESCQESNLLCCK